MSDITVTIQSEDQTPTVIISDNNLISVDVAEAEVIEVNMSQEGPQGPRGIGGTGGGSSYIHNQVSPSSEWTVVHNLGYRPGGITVLDTAGDEWKGKIEHIDENSYKISFGGASFAGVVYNS